MDLSLFQYDFMRRAFLIGTLLAVIIPCIGITIVLKRLSMMGESLAHSSLAGVTLGMILGYNPTLCATIYCVLAALGIEFLRKRFPQYSEMSIAIILSAGIGLTALLSSFVSSQASFQSFLFGSIVAISDFEMGLVVASKSPVAADIVCLRLMGMSSADAPHIDLVREHKGLDEKDIRVFPEDALIWSRRFVRASEQDLGLNYPQFSMLERGACSGCHAAILQFFRYHHADFPDKGHITLACGNGLKEEELRAAEGEVVLVGNCTAGFRDAYPFCKGCPPVPSQIKRTVEGGKTFDD